MNKVEKTVLVMHSAQEMFNLVDRVEDYPQFLPWCGGIDLHERTDVRTSATLHINYHGIKQNFTTINSKVFPISMDIALKDGPFKHLEGDWRFIELRENACKIQFRLNYEFANGFLEKLISPVFNHIATTFVDSFVTRADNIYPANKD
ncbi:MAG: type II toxin-antitoxin system RatA family toxin [Methylophilaceae bacterium]|jgi:ribosome-associated toxin RatA of RatAB toxin-antitoxin module|nr:MAG: type II toxin-antitoxin system RatA family toxin [Methylophilaceae bacterium]